MKIQKSPTREIIDIIRFALGHFWCAFLFPHPFAAFVSKLCVFIFLMPSFAARSKLVVAERIPDKSGSVEDIHIT